MEKTTFLIIGMAGTGKSTFSARLNIWLSSLKELNLDKQTGLNSDITLVNLDPAVLKAKTPLDIDIRESFDIENVMKTYNLGPNGAVTTTLNLFLMQWDAKIHNRYGIIDTPGQIEAFVWSNGGKVLVNKLLNQPYQEEIDLKTKDINEQKKHIEKNNLVILYLLDSEECSNPSVFMCNMVYSLMIKMRFKVPVVLVFNKIDLAPVPIEWIQNFEKFMEDIDDEDSMHNSLLKSMALHFEEYYKNFDFVGVSAHTGAGKEDFFKCLENMSLGIKTEK